MDTANIKNITRKPSRRGLNIDEAFAIAEGLAMTTRESGSLKRPCRPGRLEALAREAAALWGVSENFDTACLHLSDKQEWNDAYAKSHDCIARASATEDAIISAKMPTSPPEIAARAVAEFQVFERVRDSALGHIEIETLISNAARRALENAPDLLPFLCNKYTYRRLLAVAYGKQLARSRGKRRDASPSRASQKKGVTHASR